MSTQVARVHCNAVKYQNITVDRETKRLVCMSILKLFLKSHFVTMTMNVVNVVTLYRGEVTLLPAPSWRS